MFMIINTNVAFILYFALETTLFYSKSCNHKALAASEGMRQSPRGLRLQLPTFGPSGRQLRLNC